MGAPDVGPPVIFHGPHYFHLRDLDLGTSMVRTQLIPTTPEEVGSPPVTHTGFWFTTPEESGGVIVMLTGEHTEPPDPVITEAQIQLYGAQEVTT